MAHENSTSVTLPLGAFARVNDKLLADVYALANYAEDYGYPQLTAAVDLGNNKKDIAAIAEALHHLSKSEMFMIRGGAKDLYPRWCEAFGLRHTP